jgi:hypothetical protein
LTACGGGANPIIGEWEATKPALTFKFFQDGTVTFKQDGRTFTGQYKSLDGENIRIDMQGDLGLKSFVLEDIKIAGDTLTATLNGQQIALSRAGKSSSQSPADPQVAPASPTSSKADLDLNSLKALVGKWEYQSSIVEFVLEADGRINLGPDSGTYLGVQPKGSGKFFGQIIFVSPSSNEETGRQSLEIQMSGDGQKLDWRQQNNEGKWTPATFIRFDETKPPTATPAVGGNLIPNASFEEGESLPAGWVPKAGSWPDIKAVTTTAHIWDATQAHSGQRSLGIIAPQANYETTWELSQLVSIKPGRRYQVALWYRSTLPATGPTAYLSVIIPRDNGSSGKSVVRFTSTDGEWKFITAVFASEAGANGVKLALNLTTVDAPLDSSQGIWIDDVSFAEIQ